MFLGMGMGSTGWVCAPSQPCLLFPGNSGIPTFPRREGQGGSGDCTGNKISCSRTILCRLFGLLKALFVPGWSRFVPAWGKAELGELQLWFKELLSAGPAQERINPHPSDPGSFCVLLPSCPKGLEWGIQGFLHA